MPWLGPHLDLGDDLLAVLLIEAGLDHGPFLDVRALLDARRHAEHRAVLERHGAGSLVPALDLALDLATSPGHRGCQQERHQKGQALRHYAILLPAWDL